MLIQRPSLFLAASCAVAVGFTGCADQQDPELATVRDSAGVTIVENSAPAWTAEDRWRIGSEPSLDIGVVDGEPEYQFFEVAGAVRMPDGGIVVANSASGEVRFFDSAGDYLSTTGGKGSGPGEFEDIFFLRRTVGDSLLAYDWRNRRVSVLSPNGGFTRSFEFTVLTTTGGFPVVSEPFPDGDILLVTDMFSTSTQVVEGAKRDSALYYVVDPNGEVAENLGAFPGGESYETTDGENWIGGGLVFGRFGYAAVSGTGFYYGSADRWEIEYRDKEGNLTRLIRMEHENLPVTQDDIDRYIADRLERTRPERRPIHETMYEHMPFPSTMPAYSDFRVDASGHLWVGEYRKPGDDQPRWRVLDPTGRYLGIMETPPGFSIYEIGSNYLLGRWRDDLGVEHVRMYDLVR